MIETHSIPLFHLTDLRKDFVIGAVTVPALAGVSLTISSGEFIALKGPSGSGKSTLLNVLGLIENPTGGEIQFEGRDLKNRDDKELTKIRRHSIGYIFQTFNLIPILSALENVEYPLYLDGYTDRKKIAQMAREALASVGLEKVVHHRPAQLSGGQRQRVAIARAIVKNPKLILADEPTANLDSKTAAQIINLIEGLRARPNVTVVIATHDEAIARRTERQVHLKDGAIEKFLETGNGKQSKRAGG